MICCYQKFLCKFRSKDLLFLTYFNNFFNCTTHKFWMSLNCKHMIIFNHSLNWAYFGESNIEKVWRNTRNIILYKGAYCQKYFFKNLQINLLDAFLGDALKKYKVQKKTK